MTSAAAISAQLRRAGLNPLGSGTPRTREGLRVTKSGPSWVRVHADLDSRSAATHLADDAAEVLADAGYEVSPIDASGFNVRRTA